MHNTNFGTIKLYHHGTKQISQSNYWKRPFAAVCFKVYMTDFFLFAQLNLLNVLISIAKKNFESDFPSSCFDVPKASNFTSSGIQSRKTKNRRLGTIVTSFEDLKLREKQISPTFSYFLLNNTLFYHFLAN